MNGDNPRGQNQQRCRERSGFLFAHKCEHRVVATCAECEKPVCTHHRRSLENRQLCIACYKQQARPPEDPGGEGSRGKSRYYSYYDDPFWYSHYHYSSYSYYDSRDYRAFDRDGGDADFSGGESDWEAS